MPHRLQNESYWRDKQGMCGNYNELIGQKAERLGRKLEDGWFYCRKVSNGGFSRVAVGASDFADFSFPISFQGGLRKEKAASKIKFCFHYIF